ncbi:hypothetical protein HUU62_00735 [Rhodoferax sp. 4810]|nr:hypothetical protein [Rhodoferax jenense]
MGRPLNLITRLVMGVSVLLGLACTKAVAEDDAQVANNYYKYANAELEAVCARMSPSSYASGLTDGAWLTMPFAGRTYYYRSHCYMELARRTAQVTYCQQVKERSSLLGDGSAVSPASCERLLAAAQAASRESQASADRHAVAVKGAFTLKSVDIRAMPDGAWQLTARVEGVLSGPYRLEIERLSPRKLLAAQDLQLTGQASYIWTLARADVVGSTPVPAIFALAVSLYYVMPSPLSEPGGQHLTSIQNLTLSVP